CFAVIEPFFSGGASAFSSRYGWLEAALLGHDPLALGRWLVSPEVRAYLALELLSGGVVALLAPLQLMAAMPLVAINALSGFDWMRSGGGHYSVLLAPLLLWAAMHAVRWAKGRLGKPWATVGLGVAFVSVAGAQAWVGASPLHPGFNWPAGDPRASDVLARLSVIPAQASLSTTSDLYPHLSARHDAYWFPATAGADWLALDVAGGTHPLSPAAMRDATLRQLTRPDVEVETASSGLLVLHRQTGMPRDGLLTNDAAAKTIGDALREDPATLPAQFYAFATLPAPATTIGPVRFGPLELIGYQLRRQPEVGLLGDSGTLTTFWRAAEPTDEDLRFALAATRASDGALSGFQEDAAAAPLWLPSSRWQPGKTMSMDMTLKQLHDVQALGVAVEDTQGKRLPASGPGQLWEGGTIAAVVRLG
ncbi:MAG TPA: DUF2079 domain-containing protein, partial [Chloroflexota bacterium]|nr:DUF2079 domain-containing protein [Chloroflexota bacterium]